MKTVSRSNRSIGLSVLFASAFLVSACGGGGNATATNPDAASFFATAVQATVPAGVCPNGGITVEGGIDVNGNKVLDANEVTSTQYVCNGAPGANGTSGSGVPWVRVTGTSIQAQPNTGYLADTSAAPVTITLPVAPAVGDTVQVSGLSAGGWRIAQNAGQLIITQDLVDGIGVIWRAKEVPRVEPLNPGVIRAVAMDAASYTLVAAEYQGYLYTSDDFGITWTPRMTDYQRGWNSVAVSANGAKMIASESLNIAVGHGYLHTSIDYGRTWTRRMADAPRGWNAVASSADGNKLVAAVWRGQIYTSTNAGATWMLICIQS